MGFGNASECTTWALVVSALVREVLPGVVATFEQRPVEMRG